MFITPYTVPVAVSAASPTAIPPITTTIISLATASLSPRVYVPGLEDAVPTEPPEPLDCIIASTFSSYPATTCLPYSAYFPLQKTRGIDAACFTLTGPSDWVPVSLPYYEVDMDSCSSVKAVTTTSYSWYHGWYGDEIKTYTMTYPGRVSCRWHMTEDNLEYCEKVSPLGWAALVMTFLTIQVSWWASDLPLLSKPRDQGGGLRAYLDAVVWACVRANSPMSAGMVALYCGPGPAHAARIYYQGVRTGPDGHLFDGRTPNPRWRPGRSLKYWTSVLNECISLITAIITIVKACTKTVREDQEPIPFSESSWVVPTLPTTLVGLFLLALELLLPPETKVQKRWMWILFVGCLAIGGGLTALLWKFDASTRDMWYIIMILYFFMSAPISEFGRRAGWAILGAWMVRAGGVTVAAFNHYGAGQPWCRIPGNGFAIAHAVLGAISTILGVCGAIVHIQRLKQDIENACNGQPTSWEKSVLPQTSEFQPSRAC